MIIARAYLLKTLAIGSLLLTTACGATPPPTQGITPVMAITGTAQPAPSPDLSAYDTIVLLDFTNKISTEATTEGDALKAQIKKDEILFANKIAAAIINKHIFKQVSRAPVTGKALLISGVITEYEEGNRPLKLLVGLGAGMTKLNAKLSLYDNINRMPLGVIMVTKDSWVFGGAVAANQDIAALMQEASLGIADQIEKAKSAAPSAAK